MGSAVVLGTFTLVTKKARGPADQLAAEEFAHRILEERLQEANADRAVLTATVTYLREDARRRDATDAEDFEREQERAKLVRELQTRIGDLETQIRRYEHRLESLAYKVRMRIAITLSDIYESTLPEDDLEDLEDTFRS